MSNNEVSASTKFGAFLEKNVKVLIGVIICLIVLVAVGVLSSSLMAKSIAKGISEVEKIEFAFRKDADGLSDADFVTRQDKALSDIEVLAKKSGIVGVRANMLKAEILFEKKDFENSKTAWIRAADSKKNIYTAAICYYNAAVCSENLKDLDSAIEYYTKSVDSKEFFLIDHAYFSLGRVNETKGNYEEAISAYEKLCDLHPTSRWTPLAKDRIIAVKSVNSSN